MTVFELMQKIGIPAGLACVIFVLTVAIAFMVCRWLDIIASQDLLLGLGFVVALPSAFIWFLLRRPRTGREA